METIKQLSSFMVLNMDGADRVSFTFNEVDTSGELVSQNNKKNFIAVDGDLQSHITAIRDYIRDHKLN